MHSRPSLLLSVVLLLLASAAAGCLSQNHRTHESAEGAVSGVEPGDGDGSCDDDGDSGTCLEASLEASEPMCLDDGWAKVDLTASLLTTGSVDSAEVWVGVDDAEPVQIGTIEPDDFVHDGRYKTATFDFDLILENGSHTVEVCFVQGGSQGRPPKETCSEPVTVLVDCDGQGCTYTQGYWKNHPEDWRTDGELCADGEGSGLSWADVLDTPPRGEAWYILAHQWIAATLNVANGTSDNDIRADLDEAEALLDTSCDGVSDADRPRAIELSENLDDYNNGETGPGHCDDEQPGDCDWVCDDEQPGDCDWVCDDEQPGNCDWVCDEDGDCDWACDGDGDDDDGADDD